MTPDYVLLFAVVALTVLAMIASFHDGYRKGRAQGRLEGRDAARGIPVGYQYAGTGSRRSVDPRVPQAPPDPSRGWSERR